MMELKFDENGLIPAIIQDAKTKTVLMLAYMNKASYDKTIETGMTWFYSRSRQKLWHKGESSGNIQKVHNIAYDCDGDTLLIQVEQTGVACHTGSFSCFYRDSFSDSVDLYSPEDILTVLTKTIKERKSLPKDGSYTNYLLDKGIDKILKKIGEESSEIIIAAKNPDKDELIYEICDFVYHLLVLMEVRDVKLCDLQDELIKRHR